MTREQFNFNPDISNIKESEEFKKSVAEQKAKEEEGLTRWQRIKAFFKNGRTRFAMGVILMLVGLYLAISFMSFFFFSGASDQNRIDNFGVMENAMAPQEIHNAGAALGASASNFFIADGVGIAAFILVIWCFVIGYRLVKKGVKTHIFTHSLLALFSIFAFSLVIGACTYNLDVYFFPLGGYFGKFANQVLLGLVGLYGMIAVNAAIALIWVLLCWTSIKKVFAKIPKNFNRGVINSKPAVENQPGPEDVFKGVDKGEAEKPDKPVEKPKPQVKKTVEKVPEPAGVTTEYVKPKEMKTVDKITNPHDPTGEFIHYRFPTLGLLQDIKMKKNNVDIDEQEANKERITETLNNYGIQIKKIEVHVGPTITLFEIIPEDGVRISKIRGLEDDIALSLAALGIRIIAPMPGRGTIGIEVPNKAPQLVPMRQVLASEAFQESSCKLPMVLGCTVSNEVCVADLTKMPHLLVAGATGQGKSVGLNAIITSLLYKKGPSELKFVLIDPKSVEFSLYADIEKYYFAKIPGEEKSIITQPDKAIIALNCLVQEMENRYQILQKVKERRIEDYNKKWKSQLRNEKDENGDTYQFMPYIVVIIDEFSDLIMTAGKEAETPIVRIAQKARAVGIHMIIATQRPSTNVITGIIKANFPGRIAFRVTQMVDSRTIIDRSGAQQLVGKGDMLFSADGEIRRLQCPFVDTPDVEAICDFIKEQEDEDKNVNHEQPFMLPEFVGINNEDGGEDGKFSSTDRDPLFEEAVRWIVQGDTASTSSLQRRYQIGYNRAARLMDQMEASGIVSASQGGKPRKILIDPVAVDQLFS